MNIRRIMREEMDDFDWIRDVEPISYDFLLGKALYFDPPINDYKHLLPIIDALESMGFNQNWVDDFYEEYNDQIIGMYLREQDDQIIFTTDLNDFEEEYQEHIDEYAYRPVEVLDGWQTLVDAGYVTNRKDLKEESDELDWIKNISKPFIITTIDTNHRYWVSKGIPIKVGDFVVYKAASGIWREYGIMNPEKVDDANNSEDYYSVIVNPLSSNPTEYD